MKGSLLFHTNHRQQFARLGQRCMPRRNPHFSGWKEKHTNFYRLALGFRILLKNTLTDWRSQRGSSLAFDRRTPLAVLLACSVKPLQMVQNVAADHLVFNQPKTAYVTPPPVILYWPPSTAPTYQRAVIHRFMSLLFHYNLKMNDNQFNCHCKAGNLNPSLLMCGITSYRY